MTDVIANYTNHLKNLITKADISFCCYGYIKTADA